MNIDLLEHFKFLEIRRLLYDSNEEVLMNKLLDLMSGKRTIFRLLSEDCLQEAITLFNQAGYYTATAKTRMIVSKRRLV